MPKVARKAIDIGEVWNQYVPMVTKLSSSYCGAHLEECYCKESNISDANWLRYLSSLYLTKTDDTTLMIQLPLFLTQNLQQIYSNFYQTFKNVLV